jgi:aminoglycoside N3'-acetyltransferase
MPTFILGGRDYDPITYYKTQVFDVQRSVSEMGLLTEVFRRKPGARRSLHPTHSVAALGPLSEELVATHHLGTTRAGRLTPFEVMAKRQTVIIGIGVEYYRCLTQAKGVEDLLGDDFPIRCTRQTQSVRIIDSKRQEVTYQLTVRRFDQPVKATVLRSLLSPEELIEWNSHGMPLWITFADRVTQCLLQAAQKGITLYGRAATDHGMNITTH